jgi:hypothetical protein
MGADLYLLPVLKSDHEKLREQINEAVAKREASKPNTDEWRRWQSKVNESLNLMYGAGYFRDPYNDTSILRMFGLSWWKDVVPLLDEHRCLKADKTEELLQLLDSRKQDFEDNLAKQPEEERTYYRDRSQELRCYLEFAVKLDCLIECSL